MVVQNLDQRPGDYKGKTMKQYPRPSHADFTYLEKYGIKASSGGGRSSARETVGRVLAGTLCEQYLKLHGIEIVAWVSSVGRIHQFTPTAEYPLTTSNPKFLELLETVTRKRVDEFEPVRCPDAEIAAEMEEYIAGFRDANDSIGGTVSCVIRNCPPGLGEPAFLKLEATLAQAMLSIPATKGFEFG
jgi:chorismate synthase